MLNSLGRLSFVAGLALAPTRIAAQDAPVHFQYPMMQDTHAAALQMLEEGHATINETCQSLVAAHLVDLGYPEEGRPRVQYYTEGPAPDAVVVTEQGQKGEIDVRYSTFSEPIWNIPDRSPQ